MALLALGMTSLVSGVWGGLIRLPFNLPLPGGNAAWITYHGPLMVCGFLGTVIGLERAVGLGKLWTYCAPLFTGAGAVLLALGYSGKEPIVLIVVGSAFFAALGWRIVTMQPVAFTIVMALGAMGWLAGNSLWLAGWSFNRVVPWWIAFLALIIFGERLDLSRFQRPSPWSKPLMLSALGLFGAGVVVSTFSQITGERITGAGLIAMASWLARFDIARRTVRQPGLSRFMAVCLLVGYFWLLASGLLMMIYSPLESGLRYDSVLHSFFLGFVFSMIFGHAPVIFPAVLQLPPAFRSFAYSHVVLLHAGLLLRVGSDVVGWGAGRQWGGALNATAVGLFLVNTVASFILAKRPSPRMNTLSRKG